jgi:hypothetical protein
LLSLFPPNFNRLQHRMMLSNSSTYEHSFPHRGGPRALRPSPRASRHAIADPKDAACQFASPAWKMPQYRLCVADNASLCA